MVHAFVFVDVAPGVAETLPPTLSDVGEIREAHVVAGDHDVVFEVETETMYDVLSTVTEHVRTVDGVEETRTYVTLE
jgi:DNA-binding Lrp family transcriptional regulator